MRWIGVFTVGVMAMLLTLHASGVGVPDNVAVTHTYIDDQYMLDSAIAVNLPASDRAVKSFVSRIVGECPDVLAGAPPGVEKFDLGLEDLFVLDQVIARSNERAGVYYRAVRHLHWTSVELTQLVQREGKESAVRVNPLPDLCADFKAWAASDYQVLPESTMRFLHRREANTLSSQGDAEQPSGSGGVIWRLLSRYETSSDRSLVDRVKRLEARLRRQITNITLSASLELSKRLGAISAT